MDLKKKLQDVSLCKKVSAFWKNTIFPIAMQENTQNRKLTLKICFWGSSATSILNFIYFWKAETFLHKTYNFQIGICTGSQWQGQNWRFAKTTLRTSYCFFLISVFLSGPKLCPVKIETFFMENTGDPLIFAPSVFIKLWRKLWDNDNENFAIVFRSLSTKLHSKCVNIL